MPMSTLVIEFQIGSVSRRRYGSDSTWQPLCPAEQGHLWPRWWRRGRGWWAGAAGGGGGEARSSVVKVVVESRWRRWLEGCTRCARWSPSPPPRTRACFPSCERESLLKEKESSRNLNVYWVQGLRPSILAVTSTYMPHAYTFGFYLSHHVTCHFSLIRTF